MTYQDKWLNGQLIEKGTRECANRYGLIQSFCQKYNGPFSVCDIGANMCYFGIRLTEDFPQCTVMAFEFNSFEMREAHLKANKASRVLLFRRKVTLDDVQALSRCCRFDVVLALSVLHHVPGNESSWISALRGLGENVIVEFAVGDSVRASRKGYQIPSDAIVLGAGESHLKPGTLRPIVRLPGNTNYEKPTNRADRGAVVIPTDVSTRGNSL